MRLVKTRSAAQALAAAGHFRIDGRVVDRAHAAVRVGQVLSFPLHDRVRVLRVSALPVRRGPAPEARACYDDLDAPCERLAGSAGALTSPHAGHSRTPPDPPEPNP